MTTDQRDKLRRLAGCRLFPGSWDKRFIVGLSAAAEPVELSEKQAAMVEALWHKYRRQLANRRG